MKILLVDDEPPARERLAHLLEELPDYTICGEANNGFEALDIAQDTLPDIVLMDIRMPRMDGLEAAHYLSRLETPPAVVFTTAFDEHALAAFEANAAAYILKPVRKEHLHRALQGVKALNRAQLVNLTSAQQNQFYARSHICTKLGNRLELISIKDIYYFQADSKYVTIHHQHGEAVIEETLKSLEQDLSPQFIRIHRNALVAAAKIAALQKNASGYQVTFKGIKDRLEISRRHLSEVRRFLRSS